MELNTTMTASCCQILSNIQKGQLQLSPTPYDKGPLQLFEPRSTVCQVMYVHFMHVPCPVVPGISTCSALLGTYAPNRDHLGCSGRYAEPKGGITVLPVIHYINILCFHTCFHTFVFTFMQLCSSGHRVHSADVHSWTSPSPRPPVPPSPPPPVPAVSAGPRPD